MQWDSLLSNSPSMQESKQERPHHIVLDWAHTAASVSGVHWDDVYVLYMGGCSSDLEPLICLQMLLCHR